MTRLTASVSGPPYFRFSSLQTSILGASAAFQWVSLPPHSGTLVTSDRGSYSAPKVWFPTIHMLRVERDEEVIWLGGARGPGLGAMLRHMDSSIVGWNWKFVP